MRDLPIGIQGWLDAYGLQGQGPCVLIAKLLDSLYPTDVAWIYRCKMQDARCKMQDARCKMQDARCKMQDLTNQINYITSKKFEDLPLYGVPFVVKDSIDLASTPTTAGCPAFAYTPSESVLVVQRLLVAGTICIGKANLNH